MNIRLCMARSIFVQRALLSLCVFALVQLAVSVVYAHVIDGYVGVDLVAVSPFVDEVHRLDPRSPTARDGLRVRDRIDIRALSPSDRTDWATYLKVGKRYDVPVVRAGSRTMLRVNLNRNIADDPAWRSIRWQFYIGFVGITVMLVLAGFMLLKRPHSSDVALLSATLILIALGEDFGHFGAWDTMNDALTQIGFAISPGLLNGGLALLATYALRFASPPSMLRRVTTGVAYVIAAVAALGQAFESVAYWRGAIDDSFGFFSSMPYQTLVNVVPFLMFLFCALLAIRDARGEERSRITWATGSLAMLYVSPVIFFFVQQFTEVDWQIVAATKNFSFPIAAIGLTYALLGRRLLDVGFALNRAAVFGIVSLLVVGAFSLVEWALGGWLASASRSTNVVVSASLALALGLAIHPIHSFTDRFVDSVFFRKRHAAEQALRTFAKEAAFITNPQIVIERATAVVRSSTDCTSAEILLLDEIHANTDVDVDDPALVSLRASHDTVSLRGLATRLRGEFCFPMSAGGKLVGALIVGSKRLGESFAPDERDALAYLAHGVGVALALLGANTSPSPPPDSRSQALSSATLVAAMESLSAALAIAVGREREPWDLPPLERRDIVPPV